MMKTSGFVLSLPDIVGFHHFCWTPESVGGDVSAGMRMNVPQE
jgi:hypothetical protein